MHRADAGAGQYVTAASGTIGKIATTRLFNAQIQQRIPLRTADIAMQFAIRDMLASRRVIAFPDNGGAIAIFCKWRSRQFAARFMRRPRTI